MTNTSGRMTFTLFMLLLSSFILRFATRAEAQQSASERYMSWTLPTGCRAAESDDPVNYKRVNGRDKHVG